MEIEQMSKSELAEWFDLISQDMARLESPECEESDLPNAVAICDALSAVLDTLDARIYAAYAR